MCWLPVCARFLCEHLYDLVDLLQYLTRPYHADAPPQYRERRRAGCVPCSVSLDLAGPERDVRLRRTAARAAVAMPEAAVDEDRQPMAGQNDIRRSRQITSMQPKPVPRCEQL